MPGEGKRFEKGNQAAKGHGRPENSRYVEECQSYAKAKGWQKLVDLAEGVGYATLNVNGRLVEVGPDPKLQFEALKLVIAYAHGRPPEKLDVTSGGESLFDWLHGQFPQRDSQRPGDLPGVTE